MALRVDHIQGQTFHGRRGAVKNAFRYNYDYVLCDMERAPKLPALFSRNARNLLALHDRDHGGMRGEGKGAAWVRDILSEQGIEIDVASIQLLAQPRLLGYVFNPVCFWLIYDAKGALPLVIAEVNNTFGERHSYLCHKDDFSPITSEDHLTARKLFHVSPFQDVSGSYKFRFDISDERVGIWIDLRDGEMGVYATFVGQREPLTNSSVLRSALRRPFGSLRVVSLIYWQALKLKLKGVGYRSLPAPPDTEVSR